MTVLSPEATPLSANPLLEKVPSPLAMANTCLYGRNLRLQCSPELTLTLQFAEFDASSADLELRVRCAGQVFDLQLVHAAGLFTQRLPLAAHIPPALLRAAILAAASDLLQGLENSLGQRLEVLTAKTVNAAWPKERAVGARVQLWRRSSDTTSSCLMMIQAADPGAWQALCMAAAPRLLPSGEALAAQIGLTLFADPVPITLNELRGLSTGDVLLMEDADQQAGLPVYFAAGGPVFRQCQAVMQGSQIRLTYANRTLFNDPTPPRRPAMNSVNPDHNANTYPGGKSATDQAAQTERVDLGSMQVEVQVEVGRLLLPLSALQNLAVGQVFDTQKSIDGGAVTLWAGGQALARGQLVALGSRVGVRVTAIQPKSPTAVQAAIAEAAAMAEQT
jgi:type III secretion protein Q